MRHSLVITSQGLDIWRYTASGIEHELRIDANDKKAGAKFRDWLAGARRRTTLIADLADERHAIERLPHTSRTERLQLIDRKLSQRFPDAAFTSATPLPACPEDGLLKPVLLSAISRSSSIPLWLDILGETGMQGQIDAPLLTSVAFLLERWYCRQRTLPPQSLLLTFGACGMRQIFFRQHHLAFSRVVPARAATLAENLPTYCDELTQTLAWLPSQRLAEGSPPILVLAPETDFPLLRELSPSQNSIMDFIDVARCSGGSADVLSLVLRETHQGGVLGHYNCPSLRRARQLTAVRHAVWIVTVAVLAAGLAASATELIDATRLRQETGQLTAERQQLQNELEKLNAKTIADPGADVPDDWLDKTETLANDTGIAPANILQAVAGLLDKATWARLESLAWKRQTTQDKDEIKPSDKSERQTPQTGNTGDAPADTPSASIELEISLSNNEPPQTAADKLISLWQQQYDSPMRANIDSGMARLRLDTALALPAREKLEKAP
ncbi:MAG: hypothetical protein FWG26_00795 [Betaproteobacteria bacterium]|nr:hypothetical protein [Betaproteobacteria bacterium]